MPPTLCQFQESALETVLRSLASARNSLPTFLLVGSPGIGKRVIASEVARRIGIEFVEVRLDGAPAKVLEVLCGSNSTETQTTDGELRVAGPRLVYLSHLEGLHHSLFRLIAGLLQTGTYTDASGETYRINEDAWIGAGLSLGAAANVTPEHWISAAFHLTVRISEPTDVPCFLHVARNVIAEIFTNVEVSDEIGELLAAHRLNHQNFHAVRRWMISAYTKSPGMPISVESVKRAILEDLDWTIRSLEYKGRRLEVRHVERWLSQIGPAYQPLALRLVWLLANKYFIGQDEYYRALNRLVEESQVPVSQVVSFCKWQPLGRSAPHMAHDIKNCSRWKVGSDIDLSLPATSWPQMPVGNPAFILSDDFVGSGLTLSRLGKGDTGAALRNLSTLYPDAAFILIVMVAYEKSLADAIATINKMLGKSLRVCIYRLLTEADRCFSPSSILLPTEGERKQVRDLCLASRAKYFKSLSSNFVFGFESTASFFAFYNSVPNNSLPILWHDQAKWFPLLPAGGSLS